MPTSRNPSARGGAAYATRDGVPAIGSYELRYEGVTALAGVALDAVAIADGYNELGESRPAASSARGPDPVVCGRERYRPRVERADLWSLSDDELFGLIETLDAGDERREPGVALEELAGGFVQKLLRANVPP